MDNIEFQKEKENLKNIIEKYEEVPGQIAKKIIEEAQNN